MEYRIVEREPFAVAGRLFAVTCRDGENLREIPKRWAECHRDGTIARLEAFAKGGSMYGIVLDMQPNQERFTYMIGCEADPDDADAEPFETRTIPASAWAVFTSVGPMPGAIQSVFARIYREWFPATGCEHSGGPEMEVYPPGDTTADDYRCEVWVPIVRR